MGCLDYTHYVYLSDINTRYPFRVIHDRSIVFMEFAHEMAVTEVERCIKGFTVISSKVGYLGDSKYNKIKYGQDQDNWDGHEHNYIFQMDNGRLDFRNEINKLNDILKNTTFDCDLYSKNPDPDATPNDDYLFGIYGRSSPSEKLSFRYFVNMVSDILWMEGRLFYVSGGHRYIPKHHTSLDIKDFMNYYGKTYYFDLYAYINPSTFCYNLLQRMAGYVENTIDTFGHEAINVLQLYTNLDVLKGGLK